MTNRKKILLAVIGAVVLVTAGALYSEVQRKRNTPYAATTFLMNTVVEYKLYGPNAQRAQQAIEKELRGIEDRMSLYLADSEIARLNAGAGGEPVTLSPDTFDLLRRCKEFGRQSGGVFDVTIAPLTEQWGITSDHPAVPSPGRIDELLALVDFEDILMDGAEKSARLAREGQAVDVGGVAKGYACDAARRAAQAQGLTSGYISIGGNLMVVGAKPDGKPFKFGVRDPRAGPNDFVGIVTLPDSTMATSGDYERYFEQDGVRYHHILDPATGYPADTDLMSVSVVTPDGAYADFMSTYLFIKGREFTLSHLNSFDCGLVVIDKQKRVYVSESLKDSFTPSDETGTYRFGESP